MSSTTKWTKNSKDLEIGALYVMTNRGKWHVDVYPKEASLSEKPDFAPDTRRAQFIGQPDTLYYGPIPWPAKELRNWPDYLPPSNVFEIKKR